MHRRVGRHLVLEAMALGQRENPSLHHSDRGSKYTRDDFRALLQQHGIECSMSGRDSCYDNAPVESFSRYSNASVSDGKPIQPGRRPSRIYSVYIECFYNRLWRHSYLGYVSPEEYENQAMSA